MSRPSYLYDLQRKRDDSLVRKIKQIADGLELLARLIGHGEMVAPDSEQTLETYTRFVSQQIDALTVMIKGLEDGITNEELGNHVDLFHESCQAVLTHLGVMTELPTLNTENELLEGYLEDYNSLEQSLVQNPSREALNESMHDARLLLAGINKTLMGVLEHPYVEIARCATQGAAIQAEIKQGIRLKI